jgi:outer membrane protein TolC
MRRKIMKNLWCLILVIGLTVPGLAGAAVGAPEGSDQKQPLSLDTAVAIALDKNPSIRAALEGITAAKEASSEARAPFYPELGFAAGYNRWEKHAFLPSGLVRPDIPKIIGPTNDWHTGLQTSYLLFDSGRRRAELQAALARVGVAEEDAAMNRQDIILLVHQAYFGLMAAKEAEAVARKKLARAEEHSRLAIARKEAGAVPRADVVRAQVEIADARLALEREASVVRIARGSLNTAMGLPAETSTEINDKYLDVTPPAALQIQESLGLAIRERPEIKAARKRIEAATKSVTAARSAFGPKVRAEGSFGWRDSELLPHDKDWMAGFSVELPLFTGFSSKHRLGRTKAELSREGAELEALILAVRQEVWAAYSRLQESFERIRGAEPLVQDAQESVRLAQERYGAGAGTITELLDSEAALARAEAIRVEAAWNYQTAKSVFQRAVGQLGR